LAATKVKAIITISIFLAYNNFCYGQALKEQKFSAAIKEVVQAFSRRDSGRLSKFIKKDIGVYQVDRIGVFDHYNHYKKLGFTDTTYSLALLTSSKGIKLLPLQYASLPTYDCGKEAWSKKGLFVDTTKTDHLLSEVSTFRNKHVPDNIPEQKIKFFFELETKSRRVVLYDHNGKELVFYLTYIGGNWFLTVIDNVTSDCGV
jgi:hypothetical protein